MIAEVHQVDISQPMYIIIPNTLKAEQMVRMMNKNLPAFLWHMLLEQGLPEQFITDLNKKTCEAHMVSKLSTCIWDAATRTLTTAKEAVREADTKAFESAAWFRDEFVYLKVEHTGINSPPRQRPLSTLMEHWSIQSMTATQLPLLPQECPPKDAPNPRRTKTCYCQHDKQYQ
jgi:hypothetical protein